jgi:hypothetical protein
MRKLLIWVLAAVLLAGMVSACTTAKYREGDYRGGRDSIE